MSEPQTAQPALAAFRLEEKSEGMIFVSVPGADYRLHLAVAAPVDADLKDRLSGVVRARARRIDVVPSGGRYIEPSMGEPRRIQGRIVGGDASADTLIVHAGVPVVVTPMTPQYARDFQIGQFVSFDVESGTTFEPI